MEENLNTTTATETNETTETTAPVQEEATVSSTPDLQELMTELAKTKRALNKASSEAADYKRKFKETLSENEKASMEKAEREAEREEQYKKLLRENTINKVEKTYLGMGYTADEAARIAVAEVDNDFEAKTKLMTEVDARKRKEYEAEWLASRPQPSAGTGSEAEEDPFLKGFNSKY